MPTGQPPRKRGTLPQEYSWFRRQVERLRIFRAGPSIWTARSLSLLQHPNSTPRSAKPWRACAGASSLLKKSTGCVIAGRQSQNRDVSRDFASREQLGCELGEVYLAA